MLMALWLSFKETLLLNPRILDPWTKAWTGDTQVDQSTLSS